ncbi:MAG: hypothetical protein GY715_10185 [Planctomycetes bacterium]|nr:hypothetical protein [Planctomycetota bacterium]
MRVQLDDTPHATGADTIGQAIDEAAALARHEGRLVVEVIVDGSSWTPLQLENRELRGGTADEIRFISASVAELVRETMAEASSMLADADTHQRTAAEHLQADQRQQAMEHLGTALDAWRSVNEAVIGCADVLDVDLSRLGPDGGVSVLEHVRGLERRLHEVRNALENDDPVGLADTLLYDLPTVVTDWQEVLQTLRREAAEKEH